jgi:hypothetical protein
MLHLRVLGKVDPPEMDFWLHQLKTKCKGPPAFVPSLWRYCWCAKDNSLSEIWLFGGVRMPLWLDKTKVKVEQAHGLKPRIAGPTPDAEASSPE